MKNIKLIQIIFIIIILITFSSAIELGVKPSKIELNLKVNEIMCKNLTLLSDYPNLHINIEDKWSNTETKNIADYKLESSYFNIEVNYTKEIIFTKEKTISICFKTNRAGKYSGVIILRTNNNVGLGIWVKINSMISTQYKTNAPITGQTIFSNNFSENRVIIPVSLVTVILLVIFIYLIRENQKLNFIKQK